MNNRATTFLAKDAKIPALNLAIVPPPEKISMSNESDNPLSDYVRAAMIEQGLSAADVARNSKRRKGDIKRSTIQAIVQGITPNPGVLTLRDLAWGINRPVEIVLAKALGRALAHIQGAPPSEFASIIDLYQQLPLTEQRGIKRYYLQALERELRRILTQLAEPD